MSIMADGLPVVDGRQRGHDILRYGPPAFLRATKDFMTTQGAQGREQRERVTEIEKEQRQREIIAG